jgi:hypothetical protein
LLPVVVVVRVTTPMVALVVDSLVARQRVVGQQVMAARRLRVMLWVLAKACSVLALPLIQVLVVVVTGVVALQPTMLAVAADPVLPQIKQRQYF